jgi:hypothetical protein
MWRLKPARRQEGSMKSGWRDERGQALLMTALSLGMIFGILGLTVDVGWAYYEQQAAQTAAESAAIAAVKSAQTLSATFTCGTDLECPSTATACPAAPISSTLSPSYNSIQIGCYYAYLDGFSAGGKSGTQSVTMAAGTGTPTTVPNVSTSYWVTARVSQSIPQLFSAINSGNTSLTASARATAALVQNSLTGCIYALDAASGVTDVTINGVTFKEASCTIYSNSNLLINGSTVTVNSINVAGTYTSNGSTVNATVNDPVPTAADPLASLPAPTDPNGTNCVAGTGSSQITTTSMVTINGTSGVTLYPGNYCGGINVNGSSNIVFSPGIYFIAGGLTVNGSNNVTGSGVMFYITPIGSHAAGAVDINGSSGDELTAPTSGTYQGVLFFENRSSSVAVTINGSNTAMDGDLYFYGSNVTYNGSNDSDVAIISQTVTVNGSYDYAPPVVSGSGPSAPPQVVLIE